MNEPTLRIVIGTAGSGKSTIAKRLARQHAAAYLDKDAMSTRFVEAALVSAGYDPGDREANPFYRDTILPLEYDSLLDVAGDNLRIGRPVVIDAPFSPYLSDPAFITAAAARFEWPSVDVEVVLVRVSPGRSRIGCGSAASSATVSSSPTGTNIGPCMGSEHAHGQASGCPNSSTTRKRPKAPRTAASLRLRLSTQDPCGRTSPVISGTTALVAHLGIPHAHVQVVADLQPLVREEGHRRRRRPDGRSRPGTTRSFSVRSSPSRTSAVR